MLYLSTLPNITAPIFYPQIYAVIYESNSSRAGTVVYQPNIYCILIPVNPVGHVYPGKPQPRLQLGEEGEPGSISQPCLILPITDGFSHGYMT